MQIFFKYRVSDVQRLVMYLDLKEVSCELLDKDNTPQMQTISKSIKSYALYALYLWWQIGHANALDQACCFVLYYHIKRLGSLLL